MKGSEQLRTYLEKFQKIENFTQPPTEPVEVLSKLKKGEGAELQRRKRGPQKKKIQ